VARAVFEAEGDDVGLAEYWLGIAWEAWSRCKAVETASACDKALAHLDRAAASQSRIGRRARSLLLRTYVYSPMPVDEALERARSLATEDHGPLAEALQRATEGRLRAMKGEIDQARELMRGARQVFAEAGLLVSAGSMAIPESEMEFEAGDWQQAERVLREGLGDLEEIGERNFYPTLAVVLALVLLNQGRFPETREWLDRAQATTGSDDLINFIFIGFIDGALLARSDRLPEAQATGLRAVELADQIDFTLARPMAHSYYAETLALAGRRDEAIEHARIALAMTSEKGNVLRTKHLRDRLAAVGVSLS
jgi:tetratricopeptide (TPR) repeat protein